MKSLNYIVSMFIFCASLTAFSTTTTYTCPDVLKLQPLPPSDSSWQVTPPLPDQIAQVPFLYPISNTRGISCEYGINGWWVFNISSTQDTSKMNCSINADKKSFTCGTPIVPILEPKIHPKLKAVGR